MLVTASILASSIVITNPAQSPSSCYIQRSLREFLLARDTDQQLRLWQETFPGIEHEDWILK